MKIGEDGSVMLTDAELVARDWFNSLLDSGNSHASALEQMMLRTPVDGPTWKTLASDDFRRYLAGIRFWGPLAKDDHHPQADPLPAIEFLDDDGNPLYEATVRRLGPDLYVVKNPVSDMEHLMTTQEIKDDDYLRFKPEPRHRCDAPGEASKNLEFTGTMGAPGVGNCYECRVCKAPWVKVGDALFRADEQDDDAEPPWVLSIDDVR